MSSAKKLDVDPYEYAKYLKRKGLETVNIHFSMEIKHPDSKARFTCKRHAMLHGTQWMSIAQAADFEAQGLSACRVCRELQKPVDEDVVDVATFQKHVKDQRKIQAKSDKKQKSFMIKRGTYGLPKYTI